MSDCGCEGSCPVCRVGEVDNHECDRCGTKFCATCHGYTYKHPDAPIGMVNPCICKKESNDKSN